MNPKIVDNDGCVNGVPFLIEHWPYVSHYPGMIKCVVLVNQHTHRFHRYIKPFSALKNSYQPIYKKFFVPLFKWKLFGLGRGRSCGNCFGKFTKSASIPGGIAPRFIHLENLMQNGLNHIFINVIEVCGYVFPKIVLVERGLSFRLRVQKRVKIGRTETNQLLNRRLSRFRNGDWRHN